MATGGALAVPATVALLRLELPPERRGRAFGMFGAIMASAAALGPIVGGVLVDAFGWEAVFVANLPVLLVSALLVAGVAPPPRRAPDGGVRLAGLAAAHRGADPAGPGRRAPGRPRRAARRRRTRRCWPAFVGRERRAADPVIAFEIFGARAFTAGTLLICLQNLVMYALLFELPLVLEHALRPRRPGDRPAADLPDGRDGADVAGRRPADRAARSAHRWRSPARWPASAGW